MQHDGVRWESIDNRVLNVSPTAHLDMDDSNNNENADSSASSSLTAMPSGPNDQPGLLKAMEVTCAWDLPEPLQIAVDLDHVAADPQERAADASRDPQDNPLQPPAEHLVDSQESVHAEELAVSQAQAAELVPTNDSSAYQGSTSNLQNDSTPGPEGEAATEVDQNQIQTSGNPQYDSAAGTEANSRLQASGEAVAHAVEEEIAGQALERDDEEHSNIAGTSNAAEATATDTIHPASLDPQQVDPAVLQTHILMT